MLADDLRGRIALDPLGAGVPGGNAAVRIEHEDGIVLDAVHQQPESFFAMA